jgi:hypothetical protein
MNQGSRLLLASAVVAAVGGGAFLYWRSQQKAPEPEVVQAPAVPASAPPAAPASAIAYPIEPPAAQPPLAAVDIGAALTELLGRKAVLSFFQLEDFPRRFVATVDNLGRAHSPPMLWPVNPTAGRFTVEEVNGATVIAPDNSSRYTPLVLLAETVDIRRAVDLYVRLYPLLQSTYAELGYPRGYFNDRLIAVIDQLLATPVIEGPIKLELTDVKGPIPSERPWVRYQYADPSLESLSAGQKILLRVGPVNGRRLKAKLAEIRAELLQRGTRK